MHHKKNSTVESRSFTAPFCTIEVMNFLHDESNDRSQRLTKQAALTMNSQNSHDAKQKMGKSNRPSTFQADKEKKYKLQKGIHKHRICNKNTNCELETVKNCC